jgi:DNA-directed RNA polymerase specialized sigma24 family protein
MCSNFDDILNQPTDPSQFDHLRNAHSDYWTEFVRTRTPVLEDIVRREKIPAASIPEVVNTVFIKLLQQLKKTYPSGTPVWVYNPQNGRFRGYLYRMAVNCARDWHRRNPPVPTLSEQDSPPEPASNEVSFEVELTEQRKNALARTLEVIAREYAGKRQFEIWYARNLLGLSVAEIQAKFSAGPSAVYEACSQIKQLIKQRAHEELARLELED